MIANMNKICEWIAIWSGCSTLNSAFLMWAFFLIIDQSRVAVEYTFYSEYLLLIYLYICNGIDSTLIFFLWHSKAKEDVNASNDTCSIIIIGSYTLQWIYRTLSRKFTFNSLLFSSIKRHQKTHQVKQAPLVSFVVRLFTRISMFAIEYIAFTESLLYFLLLFVCHMFFHKLKLMWLFV